MVSDPPGCNAGSGGGAGGGILLEASRVDVPLGAAVVANGGSGNCTYGGNGSPGLRSEAPAPGQDCSRSIDGGSGGRGGAGLLAGSDGGDGSTTGGGGGGGAGRIHINLPDDVAFDPGPPIISPTPSLGFVVTR